MSRSSRSLRALVALGLIASLITVPAGSASGDGSRGGPASVDAADVQAASTGTGYWMLDDDGEVYAFGDAEDLGDATSFATSSGFAGLIPTVTGQGYWILTRSGFLLEFGDAADHGDPRDQRTGSSLFSSAIATPSGLGLWAFTADGQVIALGDATHHGDLTGLSINGEIVDAALTPSGGGYWLLGSEGGIFAFGDAAFLGSIQGVIEDLGLSIPAEQWLNAPIVGLVASPTGDGYWLVAADGGIFAFGNAPFRGSVPGVVTGPLARPINGMVPYGNGYLMVASDGGVFTFSDQPFLGSLGANPPSDPVIGISPLPAAPLSAVAARVDNDPSSPVLYEVDFAPNQAGIESVQAFGDRSTTPPTVTGFRLDGDHARFPIDVYLRDDGRLDAVEMGDGSSARVLSRGSSTIKVEITDADGVVTISSIPTPRERVDIGVGVASADVRPAATRQRTVWASAPAHLDVRLTTPNGSQIDTAPIPVRTSCTVIVCRAPSLEATNDVEVLLGVPIVVDSLTIDKTKDCETFEWHFNTHVGWTIPALVGILALPGVGLLGGWAAFGLGTSIAALPTAVGINCQVLSAEARRDAEFKELAKKEPTVTMEVAPNFGLFRLVEASKTISFPATQRNLTGGVQLGSLVFEGVIHSSHNILSVDHPSTVRAGEALEIDVVVTGGEASGLGSETIDRVSASIGSRVLDTATGDARSRLRDRTYRLSFTPDEPGVHTVEITSTNGRTPSGRWAQRDTDSFTVLVTPPLPENCVELDDVGLGEVCTDASITAGDYSLVFVENASESTECFRDATGNTADWTGRHIGEYRYTTNVAAVRDSITADNQWRSRGHLTCLEWAFRQSTFEVTVIRSGLSFRSADDLLDAVGNELGRNPECEEFGWPSCELAFHGRTGTMNKDDAQ